MANKTIQIKNKELLLCHVSLDFSMDFKKGNEKAVRDAINIFCDELQDRFEITDIFDMDKPKKEIKKQSEPTPIKQIIDKKKAKTKKLPKPIEGQVVEKAKA